jgi:leucyl/phenylalanyl-tRNA--protein transferase
MSVRLPQLPDDPTAPFPPPQTALRQPDGLLAWGGDLSPTRLVNAYRNGVFPWYSEGDPLLWWSPDPRTVFDTDALHLPRRFRRWLRGCKWKIHADRDFRAVVSHCATLPRPGQPGTWILPEMMEAYCTLHRRGIAHSVEVYDETDELVGGIYGITVPGAFCGESMFSRESGGSKVALTALCRLLHEHGVRLLDAQLPNPHLASLGARPMSRDDYLAHLAQGGPDLSHQDWGSWLPGLPASALT